MSKPFQHLDKVRRQWRNLQVGGKPQRIVPGKTHEVKYLGTEKPNPHSAPVVEPGSPEVEGGDSVAYSRKTKSSLAWWKKKIDSSMLTNQSVIICHLWLVSYSGFCLAENVKHRNWAPMMLLTIEQFFLFLFLHPCPEVLFCCRLWHK